MGLPPPANPTNREKTGITNQNRWQPKLDKYWAEGLRILYLY
jgi:hypothetical protein